MKLTTFLLARASKAHIEWAEGKKERHSVERINITIRSSRRAQARPMSHLFFCFNFSRDDSLSHHDHQPGECQQVAYTISRKGFNGFSIECSDQEIFRFAQLFRHCRESSWSCCCVVGVTRSSTNTTSPCDDIGLSALTTSSTATGEAEKKPVH